MTERPMPERDEIDEALEETFPASDPPAWEPMHPGPPARPTTPAHSEPAPGEPRVTPA